MTSRPFTKPVDKCKFALEATSGIDMDTTTSAAAILARVRARLDATGKSAREVSRVSGGDHVIPNLSKGSVPSVDKIALLAAALETTPEFLAFGIEADDAPVALRRMPSLPPLASVPVIGAVAAGLWLDVDTAIDESPYHGVAVPPDPAYPIEDQWAVVSQGTSVNRVAPDGSVLGCVDTRRARIRPREGELVIAEQTRHGGHQIMRTAKRFHSTAEGVELWPDSDDPKWTTPIRIRRGQDDESLTIVVIGIVTWVHRPLDRSERPRSDDDDAT